MRAVASDRNPGSILQGFAGVPNVLAELVRRHLAYVAVEEPLAGNFMAAADDLGHNLGLMFADPSQHEERGLRSHLVQQVQRQFRVAMNAAFEA